MIRSNNNITYDCTYHVVWCPKWRRPVLHLPGVSERFIEIAREVCAERSATLIEIETMPDHVHLLVEVDPQFGIHKLVKAIKGRSSRLMRAEFPPLKSRIPTLWTNSYFVSTVGGAPLSKIKQYVANQRNV
jgi:putative transposase